MYIIQKITQHRKKQSLESYRGGIIISEHQSLEDAKKEIENLIINGYEAWDLMLSRQISFGVDVRIEVEED